MTFFSQTLMVGRAYLKRAIISISLSSAFIFYFVFISYYELIKLPD